MNVLTKEARDRLWEEVREEFPHDETMQEVHFVRLVHFLQTKDLTSEERVKFFEQKEKDDSIS